MSAFRSENYSDEMKGSQNYFNYAQNYQLYI